MKRILLIVVLVGLSTELFAQFNDPLFNLSVSKSQRLKNEKKVIDSVSTAWYAIQSDKVLMEYKLPDENMPIFDEVEEQPEYEGGMYQLIEYISKNQPKPTTNDSLNGLNIVKFIISDKGEVLSPQVVYSDCLSCDSISISIFNKMPRWKPAKQYGMMVNVFYTIPIIYKNEN